MILMKGERVQVTRMFLNIDEWTDDQIYFSAGFFLTVLFGFCFLWKWIPIILATISLFVCLWYAPAAFKKKGEQ